MAKPLYHIRDNLEKLPRLEFHGACILESNFSEIRAIQTSFSALVRGYDNFVKYVPKDVVKKLLTNEDRNQKELGMTQENVSIMFIDFVGFTPVCESLPPFKTVKILGDFLTAMTDVTLRIREQLTNIWEMPLWYALLTYLLTNHSIGILEFSRTCSQPCCSSVFECTRMQVPIDFFA